MNIKQFIYFDKIRQLIEIFIFCKKFEEREAKL